MMKTTKEQFLKFVRGGVIDEGKRMLEAQRETAAKVAEHDPELASHMRVVIRVHEELVRYAQERCEQGRRSPSAKAE